MAEGSAQEREATTDGTLSPLFAGGHSNLIHSVTGLAGTFNGVSAASPFFGAGSFSGDYKLALINRTGLLDRIWDPDPPANPSLVFQYSRSRDILNYLTTGDQLFYDLSPGGAAEMNRDLRTAGDIYYFSYSLCDSAPDEKTGHWVMDGKNFWAGLPIITGPTVYLLGNVMGGWQSDGYVYDGPGGPFTLDEAWWPNDGMANTVTELYPFGAPHKDFDPEHLERGTWQVMPTMQGYTHGFFGGFDFKYTPEDLFGFYLEHMKLLDQTY